MLHDNWKPVGRNDPCPCGSGKKYKHCHMRADREAAQQAKMEAAQRAEEERLAQQAAREAERRDERERLAQLRERAMARQEEERDLAAPDIFEDEDEEGESGPDLEILNEIWDAFGEAEDDHKWDICQSAIDDQLMDDEGVFEFFIVLHRDALERGLESRFVQLVLRLRQQCLDAYQSQVAYLFEWTFPFLSPFERETFLPDLIGDLIADGPRKSEAFLNTVDMLAAFGESALHAQVVRATQEAIEMAGLFEWAVDGYATQLMDSYLFEYLDNTPPEMRAEPAHVNEWIETLPFRDELLKDVFIAYLGRLAGQRHTWALEDFPVRTSGRKDDRVLEITDDNLAYLCQEFLAYLHWEKGVAFVKGELARKELRFFLANQEISSPPRKSKSRKSRNAAKNPASTSVLPLRPDRKQLDENLHGLMSFLGYQPYKGIVLMEMIPFWLEFLEERGLIDRDSHAASLRSLADLAGAVQTYAAHESLSPQLIENLAVAWATPVKK